MVKLEYLLYNFYSLFLFIFITPLSSASGLLNLFPADGNILSSGMNLIIILEKNPNNPIPIQINHYSIVNPFLWQFNGKFPNSTIKT